MHVIVSDPPGGRGRRVGGSPKSVLEGDCGRDLGLAHGPGLDFCSVQDFETVCWRCLNSLGHLELYHFVPTPKNTAVAHILFIFLGKSKLWTTSPKCNT